MNDHTTGQATAEAAPLRCSPVGVALIKQWEGFKANAYLCPAGVWTIGYGHTRGVRQGMRVTREEAEALLARDIADAEDVLHRRVRVPLTQHQFDALVSWVFNFGEPKVANSTLLRKLNKGEYAAVPNQLMRWVHARDEATGRMVQLDGLINRRAAEVGLWSRGSFVSGRDAVLARDAGEMPAPARIAEVLATDTAKGTLAASVAGVAAVLSQAEPVVRMLGELPLAVSVTAVVAAAVGVLVWRLRRA